MGSALSTPRLYAPAESGLGPDLLLLSLCILALPFWIATLLVDYYDRLYLRAFEASGRARAFAGDADDVAGFLADATMGA